MYCIKCGVQLADTETKCPLCETKVYHPDVAQPQGQSLYPPHKMPKTASGRPVFCGAIIMLFLIPLIITFFADMQRDGTLDWFGFVAGGITIIYLTFAFPMWFKKPNPVIFAPIDFAASGLLLLYIAFATESSWFMSFAFPLLIYSCVIVCTVITLCKYVRKGYLYIFGGFLLALAGFFIAIEIFSGISFRDSVRIIWSVYPAIFCSVIGIMLIIIAICKPLKESLRKKFFL